MSPIIIAAAILAAGAGQPSRNGPTIFDPASVYFKNGSAQLTPNYREFLSRFAEIASRPDSRDWRFLVMGHTDASGSARQNMLLSCRRARAVRDYLIELGVSPNRIIAEGHGAERPIPGADDDNRRVDFLVIGDPSLIEWRQRMGFGRPC